MADTVLAISKYLTAREIEINPPEVLGTTLNQLVGDICALAHSQGLTIDWRTLRRGFEDDEPMGMSQGVLLRVTVRAR